MLKICLVFWESEPQYACKRYAYKKNMYTIAHHQEFAKWVLKLSYKNDRYLQENNFVDNFRRLRVFLTPIITIIKLL